MEQSDDTHSRLLEAVQRRDRSALDDVCSLVYSELRVLAHRQRRRWDAGATLNTTALVHEAYLKLVKQRHIHVEERAQFFALAATAIRHIVSNYARDRQTRKRGGGVRTVWVRAGAHAQEALEILTAHPVPFSRGTSTRQRGGFTSTVACARRQRRRSTKRGVKCANCAIGFRRSH